MVRADSVLNYSEDDPVVHFPTNLPTAMPVPAAAVLPPYNGHGVYGTLPPPPIYEDVPLHQEVADTPPTSSHTASGAPASTSGRAPVPAYEATTRPFAAYVEDVPEPTAAELHDFRLNHNRRIPRPAPSRRATQTGVPVSMMPTYHDWAGYTPSSRRGLDIGTELEAQTVSPCIYRARGFSGIKACGLASCLILVAVGIVTLMIWGMNKGLESK